MIIYFILNNFNFILISSGLFFILFHFLTKFSASEDISERIQKVKSFEGAFQKQESNNETARWATLSKTNFITLLRGKLQGTIDGYKLRLEQAGWNSENGFIIYILSNLIGFILGISLYSFLIFSVQKFETQNLLIKVFVFILISFICIRLFEYLLDYTITRRYARIKKHLTFVVDLLGICVRAGLTIDSALEKIAEEMATINPDLCKELTQLSIELDLIPDRQVALRNLERRVDIPLVHILISSIIHSEEQGASIGNTLNVLSQEFTKHKILAIEEKAARLPVRLSLPLGLFCFPCILIILLSPSASNILKANLFHG